MVQLLAKGEFHSNSPTFVREYGGTTLPIFTSQQPFVGEMMV